MPFTPMLTDFERWKYYYDRGWATKEQVAEAVRLGILTPEEYELIVGEPYPG